MQHLLNEDTDSVADRGVHPADQTLEQPITGKQRGCQRQTEEQRAERDSEEVKAHQTPCPHEQGMASLALVAFGDRFAGDVMGRSSHPNNLGSTLSEVRRRSSSDTVNWSCTSMASLPWSTTPTRVTGRPRASHMDRNRLSSARGTATSTRPADSENNATNASCPSGRIIRQPVSPVSAASTTAWIRP